MSPAFEISLLSHRQNRYSAKDIVQTQLTHLPWSDDKKKTSPHDAYYVMPKVTNLP